MVVEGFWPVGGFRLRRGVGVGGLEGWVWEDWEGAGGGGVGGLGGLAPVGLSRVAMSMDFRIRVMWMLGLLLRWARARSTGWWWRAAHLHTSFSIFQSRQLESVTWWGSSQAAQ